MIAELVNAVGPVAAGWVMIFVIGIGFAVSVVAIYLTLCARSNVLDVWEPETFELEELPPAPPSPGSMSDAQREAALMKLLNAWRMGDHPVMECEVARRCRLSRQQTTAFMHWACGTVRQCSAGAQWLCKVERGIETRWLRFSLVTPSLPFSPYSLIPEQEASRS